MGAQVGLGGVMQESAGGRFVLDQGRGRLADVYG
jgi:hypothetical protein